MKLPDDKKERQKVLAMIGIGAAAVMYGIWAFAYEPARTAKAEANATIASLTEKISDAESDVRRIPVTERDLKAAYSNLIEFSERHMIHPRLGSSYILPARETITRHARALAIENVVVEEVGLMAMPRPKEKAKSKPKDGEGAAANTTTSAGAAEVQDVPEHTIQAYAARVSTTCSYEDFRKLTEKLEKENPLVVISNILITGQPDIPLLHQVIFEIMWPAWIDPNKREMLIEGAEQLLVAGTE